MDMSVTSYGVLNVQRCVLIHRSFLRTYVTRHNGSQFNNNNDQLLFVKSISLHYSKVTFHVTTIPIRTYVRTL